MSAEELYIEVARILKPHGLRGELKLQVFSDSDVQLARYQSFWLRNQNELLGEFHVERMRVANGGAILKLAGLDDRDGAEAYRGCAVMILRDQLPPAEADSYYIRDLMGMRVVCENGQELGILRDVIELPANDVFEVVGDRGEILIPAISGVILSVLLDQRIITVRLPEGLLDIEIT
jgi:16S rRNA processing protein RimM